MSETTNNQQTKRLNLVLPTKKSISSIDPCTILIYGKPKSGKTSVVAELEDNLILDFEEGTNYVNVLKINVNNYIELTEVINLLKIRTTELINEGKPNEKPYKFITLDTITALQDVIKPYALQIYRKNNPTALITDIFDVPFGGGHRLIKELLKKIIKELSKYCNSLIIIGHIKDKALESEEITIKDFALEGNQNSIAISAAIDGVGLINYDEKGNMRIDFTHSESRNSGSRVKHLANKNICLSTKNEDGSFTTHWEEIFPSLKK